MKQRWEAEKTAIGGLRETKAEIEQLAVRVEQAEREADYGTAAELKYGRTRELAERMAQQEAAIAALQGPGALLKEEVSADDVAEIVAAWTGIPVTRLMEGELEKLVQMEERLHDRVVGPGRGHRRRVRRRPSGARRAQGPAPAHRLVPVPGAHRRRQDRARPGARPVPVRRRAGDGPHRHERVHGEVRRVAAGRGASRLRGLRGGRPADRGGPAPAVPGDPAGRDREGAPGRVQRPAPGARRRPADRLAGPDRRLQEHRRDHDLEHRLPADPGVRRADPVARTTSP